MEYRTMALTGGRRMRTEEEIRDGVDVSGCEFYNKDDNTCREVNGKYDTDICDFDPCKNSNCNYKQLKAKEQECEELKEKVKKYGEINEQETKDYAELKAERDIYIDKYFLESQKVVNLSKVLTKIKEICNNNDELKGNFNLVDCDKYKLGKHNLANRILQKISECEGNDEIHFK